MAIDFLGKDLGRKKPKIAVPPEMHKPFGEKFPEEEGKEIMPLPEQPAAVAPKEELGEVNLITSFKSYILKRKAFALSILAVVFFFAVYCLYYYLTHPPRIAINYNKNQPAIVCGNGKIETGEQCDLQGCATGQTCVNCQCQAVVLPPSCGNGVIETGEQCEQNSDCPADNYCESCFCKLTTPPPPPPPPLCGNGTIETGEQCEQNSDCSTEYYCEGCICKMTPLSPPPPPDTEIAPLRGSLVKFADEETLYLVDWGGELRSIDMNSVSFKNGKTALQISPSLIYTLNDRFKDIRKGKEVFGYIDWDPRVLSEVELELFE